MKKIIFSFFVFTSSIFSLKAQSSAELLATKIAERMKDSLSLTTQQKIQLYEVNLSLSNQKSNIWQQHLAPDSTTIKIQRLENTRDSLYRPVLGEEKYLLYKQKKTKLVNNN